MNRMNATASVHALEAFGFAQPELQPALLLEPGRILRMGMPPMRVELMNQIDGVEFAECFVRRNVVNLDGVEAKLISLDDLKQNKRASGRAKDINDLEHLPN